MMRRLLGIGPKLNGFGVHSFATSLFDLTHIALYIITEQFR